MVEKSLNTQRKSNPQEIERTHTKPTYMPATDIYEKNTALVLVVDMPGVDEKSINISLEKGILTIAGSVPQEEYKDYRLLNAEYEIGDYQRSFAISEEIDTDKIDAAMKNGVLTVTLPKAEKAKARKIAIKVEK